MNCGSKECSIAVVTASESWCSLVPGNLVVSAFNLKIIVTVSSFHSDVWYRLFQGKGLSALHLLTRSLFFCVLWVATNYMLVYALGKLDATAVMALQASSASFVYLLSWVILHEQFVGIRVSIALFVTQ